MISLVAIIIISAGYILGFFISRFFLIRILHLVDKSIKIKTDIHDLGMWIGICEHFLIITFVLLNEYTAIGLVFAAKEFVRADKIREKPSYYLLGTLLSVSFAVFFGVFIKYLLKLIA